MNIKTLSSKFKSKFPVRKRTRPLVCLITAFLVVSGATGNLFAETGKASWYSVEACTEPHKKIYTKDCLTASGKSLYDLENSERMSGKHFAASWNYQMGSVIRVTNVKNGKSILCTVRDRGPAKRLRRIVDLSKLAFEEISSLKKGIIEVTVTKL